jgi:hypothetical protein
MPEVAIVTLLIAFPLLGAIARRWSVLLLPIAGWPLFYLGLTRGWWGGGTGDGWQFAALLLTVIGLVSTALAIALARARPRRALRMHRST